MPEVSLRTALGNYGHVQALKEGAVRPDGCTLEFVDVGPSIIAAFRRMIRGLEFDVSEMAITTYLCARSFAKPITAIPVFPLRSFPHEGILYNARSGIRGPADLAGKRVGVRAYTVTSGLWARAMLQEEYGVDLARVTWVIVDEEHVAEYQAPPNVERAPGRQLGEMLAAGEIDAAIGAGDVKADHVRPLFSDPAELDAAWLKRTGVYPINHTLVIRDDVLAAHPGLARALVEAFQAAKQSYLDQAREANGDSRLQRLQALVGPDPWPYGIQANRTTLEAVNRFAAEQRIIPRPLTPEEMFAEETVGLPH